MKGHVWMFVVMALLLPTAFGAKPTFEPAAQIPAAILDDSPPGTFYYKFTAKDPQGLNITFSLDINIQEWLQINPVTGNTTVKKKIDKEAIKIVKFKVFATNTDKEKAELETFLIITDVNNKPPIMTNVPYTKNVTEDKPIGTTVYTITIDDKDDGILAQSVLTINSGNEAGTFRLENQKIVLNQSLDYDNGVKQYVLNITAKNTQPPFPETSGVITINVLNVDDLGLEFLQNTYRGQVIKGSSVNTPIVQVQARDLDSLNETIEYKIYSDSNPGNLYAINTNTGQITVNAGLEIGSQMLVVMAVSKKHGSVITLVNMTVVAVLNKQFQTSIVEGQVNTVVMDLTTTETSFNVMGASFSIESGNYGNHFEINTTNLKVGSIPLDRETRSDYSLVIKLTKGGVVQGMATINVKVDDINDNTPTFQSSSYDITVKEDLSIGSNVVKVLALDPDQGLNGTVKYIITNNQGLFSIDNSTGQITLSRGLDREQASSHVIIVKAYDGGSPESSNSTNITITVEDVNDNSPVITPTIMTVNVNEDREKGSQVTTIVATDADQGQNAKISYTILSGAEGHFKIDSSTGVISTLETLSHKNKPTYSIAVVAMDNGTSPRSTISVVFVSVLAVPVNNHKPVFKSTTYIGGIYKDTSDNSLVLSVSAEDGDSGSNGEILYNFNDGNGQFFMDAHTGALKTANSFAEKEGKTYKLTVKANDRASPPKVSDPDADVYVLVLQASHSVSITAGVNQQYILQNLQEFQRALDDLTNGKAFIKSVRPGNNVNTTLVLFNVVDTNSTKERSYEDNVRILGGEDKKNSIDGKYQKWHIQLYGRPSTAKRTAANEGLSAVVGAMICLAVMIGIGGIIMIIILIKKKRERERVCKAARVTFNDKPQFFDPISNPKVSNNIENAQEAQEVIVHMSDESSSVTSDDVNTSPLNYTNDAYYHENSDDDNTSREENVYEDEGEVHFSTFFPPPPSQPPPPVPDVGEHSEEESTDNEYDHVNPEYIHAVLPPHEDFADPGDVDHYHESPTHSVTDSTTNLVDPSSYKNSLVHDPTLGFRGPSSNNNLTTEL